MAIAEYTRDADLAIDTERITSESSIGEALVAAGFEKADQPGTWTTTRRTSQENPIPVDFLVAESMSGRPGKRAAVVPGQPENSARQVRGLEGALVDNDLVRIASLDADPRSYQLPVAGPAALIVAKSHKIAERFDSRRSRDKDALDIYRILRAYELGELTDRFALLLADSVSSERTREALAHFSSLCGTTSAPGTDMVVRATSGLEPEDGVRLSSATLAQDLLGVVGKST